MRTITLEEHYATSAFMEGPGRELKAQAEAARDHPQVAAGYTKLIEELCDLDDGRIAAMDAAGIDVQVLSLTFPGVEQLDAAEAVSFARYARPPAKEHKEHRTLTVPQSKEFFTAAAGDRLEALYVLALTTGLRRGELLGLKWADINLEKTALSVNRSMDTLYGPPEEKAPKRQSSRRTVLLVPEAVAALRLHRRRQAEERLAAGPAWRERDLVFPTTLGTPMLGNNLLKRNLRPLLEKAGLPPLTFHELRHTFATFHLASGGKPKVIQEILGHSSIKTTMDTYSHVIPGMQEEATERLQQLLFGSAPVTLPSKGENAEKNGKDGQEKMPRLQDF